MSNNISPAKIYAVKPTSNPNKVQLEVRDENTTRPTSIMGRFNASDSRFSRGSVIYHWMTVEIADAVELLPALKPAINQCIKNGKPEVLAKPLDFVLDGEIVKIQIKETHSIKESDFDYLETKAKKIPVEGGLDRYLLANGMLIFRNTSLVPLDFLKDENGQYLKDEEGKLIKGVQHTLIKHDSETTDLTKAHFISNGMIYNGALEVISLATGEMLPDQIA